MDLSKRRIQFGLLTLILITCFISVPVAFAEDFSHTITLDGTNDFYDSNNAVKSRNETFSTSSSSMFSYLTWDANNVYFAYNSNDIRGNQGADASKKWILAYFGGAGGTTKGINYAGQEPNLPFEAKYHFRFKVDGSYTNMQVWNGTAWTNSQTYAWVSDAFRSDSNQFVEFKIPRSHLGLTANTRSLSFVSALAFEDTQGSNDTMWASVPSDAFSNGNGFDRDFSTYYEFDLKSENTAPAAQVYNYKLKLTSTTSTTANVSFSSQPNATGIAFQQSTDGGTTWNNSTTSTALNSTLTTAIITNLTPNSNYQFRMVVSDGTFPGSSVIVRGKTLAAVTDTTSPTAPGNLSAGQTTYNSTNLTWNASTDNVGVTGYDVFRNGTKIDSVAGNVLSYAATGLSPQTSYIFSVTATDAAGNSSAPSNTIDITTLQAPPSKTVTLYYKRGFETPHLHYRPVGGNWTTEPGVPIPVSEISGYNKIIVDIGQATSIDAAFNNGAGVWDNNNSQNYTIPAGVFTYMPGANNQNGTVVTGPPDTTAPSSPTDVSASNLTYNSVTVSWFASTDNVAVTGYDIFSGNTKLGTVSAGTLTYLATGLSAETSYSLTVIAFDAEANRSVASVPLQIKTLPAPPSNKVIIYYKKGFSTPYIHYKPEGGNWTTAPGIVIPASSLSGYHLIMIEIGTATQLQAAFNNGAGVWDNNNNQNYTFPIGTSTYLPGTNNSPGLIVSGAPDTSNPSTPTNLNASGITGAGFTVNWNPATDDNSVSAYEVFVNDVLTQTVTGTTVILTGLSEFTDYSIAIKAVDVVGNRSTASAALQVKTADVTAPSTPTDVAVSDLSSTSLQLSWTASNDNDSIASYDIFINNVLKATVNQNTAFIEDLAEFTDYVFSVRARDKSGNLSTDSTALAVRTADLTPPSTPANLMAGDITATDFKLTWTASTDNDKVSTYTVYLNGVQVGTTENLQFEVSGLADSSEHVVQVTASDPSANVSVKSQSILVKTLDITAPSVPDNLQSSDITDGGFTVTWEPSTDNDSVESYGVYLNDMFVASTIQSSFIFTGLNELTVYEVRIKAVDPSGNSSVLSQPFTVTTVDGTPPTAPTGLQVDQTMSDGFRITWNASNDNGQIAEYRIYIDNSFVGSTALTEYTSTGLMELTTYDVVVTAVDEVGNESTPSALVNIKTTESTPPSSPTNLSVSNLTGNGFKLSWSASSDNTSVAGYRVFLDGSFVDETTDTQFEVSGLQQLTNYTVSVVAYDGFGNESLSSDALFLTTLDTTAPTIPDGFELTAVSTYGFIVSWNNAMDNDMVQYYKVYLDGQLFGNSDVASYIFDNLNEFTSYEVTVTSVDPSGNESEQSEPLVAKTEDGSLPSAPADVSASKITGDSISLLWSASEDNDLDITYEIYVYGQLEATTKATNYTLSNLLPFTDYLIEIVARDSSGNASESSGFTMFTTLDVSPPSTPQNLQLSSVSGSEVSIYWDESTDNDQVVAYRVYLNGKLVDEVAETTYTIVGLQDNTEYEIYIVAIDNAFNESAQSELLSVKTPDETAPTIPDGLTAAEITGSSFVVAWDDSFDANGDVAYELYLDDALYTSTNETSYEFSGLDEFTEYKVTIRATDSNGNVSDYSEALLVSTSDGTPPSKPTALLITNIQIDGFTLSWNASTDNIAVAGYRIYLNDQPLPVTVTQTSYTLTGLQDLTLYEVAVSALDDLENESQLSSSIQVETLDGTPPSIPTGIMSSEVTENGFMLSWNASSDHDALASYQIYLNGTWFAETENLQYEFTGLADSSSFSIQISAKDASGNESAKSSPLTVKTKDIAPPTKPTNLQITNQTNDGFTVSWNASTDNDKVDKYEIYLNGKFAANVNKNTHVFSGLADLQTYSVTITAFDPAGNKSPASTSVSISLPDATPPTSPTGLTVQMKTASSVKIGWNASTDNDKVKSYQVYRNGKLVSDSTSRTFTANGLGDFTKHIFTIKAVDETGNASKESAALTVTTLDTTAPSAPTKLAATPIRTGTYKVTWDASVDNDSIREYHLYLDDLLKSKMEKNTFTLSGLKYLKSYTISVRAVDQTGNLSPLRSLTFKVTDATPPTITSKVTISSPNASGFRLSWTKATDSVGVAGYEIYRNGSLIGKTSNTVFNVTGLNTDQIVVMTVKSYDKAGNKSSASKPVKSIPAIKKIGKNLYLNFKKINLGNGIVPVTSGKVDFAPYSPLLKSVGFSVKYDSKTKTVTATKSGLSIKMTVGSKIAVINGSTRRTMNASPVVIKGAVMIPISFVAETLKYQYISS